MTDLSSLIASLRSIAAARTGNDEWDEAKHPRGNPGNAGQFAPRDGGATGGSRPTASEGRSSSRAAAQSQSPAAPAQPARRYLVPDRFTFRFVVGGVNSSREIVETTAASFPKAVSNAMHRAANGNPRYIRQTWVRPVSVNGYAIRNYGIIDGDDPNRTEKAKDFQKRLVSFFSGHVPYYIPPQGQSQQRHAGLPHDGSRPEAHQGFPGQNHTGEGQPPRRMGHNAQGRPSRPAQSGASGVPQGGAGSGGKPVQTLFSFAQDAYPKRKSYYAALVKSLRSIARTATETTARVGEKSKTAVGGDVPAAQSRAREIAPKREVISANPAARGLGKRRMTPQEVRDMVKGNCSLIKTVRGADQIEGIERRIKRLYEKGNTTPETLARYLEDECGLEDWQADRIVRDQMLKYEAAARLDMLKRRGVKRVMWCAGKCEKHRPSHAAKWPAGLNGLVFDIDKPPVDPATGKPTMPGEQVNCRCYLKAVK